MGMVAGLEFDTVSTRIVNLFPLLPLLRYSLTCSLLIPFNFL